MILGFYSKKFENPGPIQKSKKRLKKAKYSLLPSLPESLRGLKARPSRKLNCIKKRQRGRVLNPPPPIHPPAGGWVLVILRRIQIHVGSPI